jgi:hypothetical protein
MRNPMRACYLSVSVVIAVLVPMLSVCELRALEDDGKKDEVREQQLKNMKRSAAQHVLSPADDRKRLFKIQENAAMRWSNPIVGVKDGAIYVWSDRGRPQAIIKLYTFDNEVFSHEWQSLSESTIIAEREGKIVWSPSEPGIAFRELTDAPKPAELATERLRQVKTLAGKFSSTYTPIPKEAKPFELRLLIQPLFRYEASDDKQCLDGAIFAFSNGTDPQGLLLFEARKSGESYRYSYAFAKMASGAVIAKYGEKEIYSAEKYDFSRDPKKTFLLLPKQPAPKE